MNAIVQGLVISFCVSIGCVAIGAGSLEHYAVKTRASKEEIKTFLGNLKFPLTFFYVNSRANFFTAQSSLSRSPEDYLANGSLVRSNITRFIMLGFISILIVGLLVLIFNVDNLVERVIYALWLILDSVQIVMSFRFGPRLQNSILTK
ncbi:MAG: hypothetical protein K8I30_23100 [Anaerolineae bacterium]|nr:hypothetical protein [Anaerolineae bacterium]